VLGANPEAIPTRPAMREPWLITFAAPEDRSIQLTPAGPLSVITWRWTLRPITGEPGVIGEVVIPWFDTKDNLPRTAVIKAAPFGYSGFKDNSVENWQSQYTGLWFGALALVLGAGIGVLAMLWQRTWSLDRVRGWLNDIRTRTGAVMNMLTGVFLNDPYRVRKGLLDAASMSVKHESFEPLLDPVNRAVYGPRPETGRLMLARLCATGLELLGRRRRSGGRS
jgi:hypothetical protein